MLDFQAQKKLLQPILKNPKNYLCADCDAISPTWASLDFGVFLCANCSGAHRALGPTITRVRSANLDKWQQDWLSNMKIGNSQLNTFWQGSPEAANRKPKADTDLNDIKRYVYQKYVKRKFVSSGNASDPLTLYKTGQYQISNSNPKNGFQALPSDYAKPSISAPAKIQPKRVVPNNTIDLLDFNIVDSASQGKKVEQKPKVQEEFLDFTQFGVAGSQKSQKSNQADLISFDTLITSHKQPQPQPPHNHFPQNSYESLKAQNMQLHHPYNPHLAQHNLAYQSYYQQQNYLNKGAYPHYTNPPVFGIQGPTAVNQSPGFWF